MRRRKSNITLPLLLLLACGALGWVILGERETRPQGQANAIGVGIAPKPVPELPADLHFNVAPIEDLQAVLERPVFSPGRRPPSPEASALPATRNFDLALKGIVVDGDERVAVFLPNDKGKAMLLREGDTAAGWTLMRIEIDHVVLLRGDAETVLEPTYDPTAPERRNRRQRSGQTEAQQ